MTVMLLRMLFICFLFVLLSFYEGRARRLEEYVGKTAEADDSDKNKTEPSSSFFRVLLAGVSINLLETTHYLGFSSPSIQRSGS